MEPNKDLRVSTMTLVSEINSNINLAELYNNLEINDFIHYIEYGKDRTKGSSVKKIKNPRKHKEKKFFYNQLTLHIYKGKIVNVKLFNNGRIQMTGLKQKQQGIDIIHMLLQYLGKLSENKRKDILDNINPEIRESRIVLINSDFDIRFKINREILHRLIVSRGYYSSYEPTIYPGVNIKYYFNPKHDNCGICKCTFPCNGKGKGCCKKITIAVFNSGKIIITGGQSYEHLNTAYSFIKDIINERRDELINK